MKNIENGEQVLATARREVRPHNARYLVLFGTQDLPRAALLDVEKHLMTEMMDADGFIVERLVSLGVPCAPPAPAALQTLMSSTPPDECQFVRCFSLG